MHKAHLSVISAKPAGGDDVVFACSLADETLMAVLADGATGAGEGRIAAERFVSVCREILTSFPDDDHLVQEVFSRADAEIRKSTRGADTTGILFMVRGGQYLCASCGDSSVWMLAGGQANRITWRQSRKPRVGSGCSVPEVMRGDLSGKVLMASDGLECALPLSKVLELLEDNLVNPARSITMLAKPKAGQVLQDDIGVIVLTPVTQREPIPETAS